MIQKPFIVIVPGSFAPPTIYQATIAHLRSAGYGAVALQLPSTVKRMPLEPASMTDDADVVKRAVEGLLGQGKEVVVVCHSYGGTPTTQALAGLKVKRIIYLAAIVPKLGQTQNTAYGLPDDETFPMEVVGGYMHLDAVATAAAACNDLPWDEAYENTLNFAHHSAASFMEKVTQLAYTEVPVSYLLCQRDLIVSPELQRGYIKVLEEGGQKVSVVELDSGHCPNWSIPEKLAEVIVGEAGKAA